MTLHNSNVQLDKNKINQRRIDENDIELNTTLKSQQGQPNKNLPKTEDIKQLVSTILKDAKYLLEAKPPFPQHLTENVEHAVNKIALDDEIHLTEDEKKMIIQEIVDEMQGFGPIEPLIRDKSVSDILVNGSNKVYIEREGTLHLTDVQFKDDQQLSRIIDRIISTAGRRIDASSPFVDARLPDGSRVNAAIPPISIDGPLISVRKFQPNCLRIEALLDRGTLNSAIAKYLEMAVTARLNIVVSGGTGSGKTTTLNAISSFIRDTERIITIEDTAELQLMQSHVVRLEARPANSEGRGEITLRDCLKNALRMRPDRIIIGEVRSDEIIDALNAMNTGHSGSMTTIHANSPRDAISRIENLTALSGIDIPSRYVRSQISRSINLIIQVSRCQDGTRKITSISELTGMEGETINLNEIFTLRQRIAGRNRNAEYEFIETGVSSNFISGFHPSTPISSK